jgi:hypothetical protein
MSRIIFGILILSGFFSCQKAELPTNKYELIPFSTSVAFEDAQLVGYQYENGQFTFEISNYTLGEQTSDADSKMCANSKDGQHLHVIIDTMPYEAKYTATFDFSIADGTHFLLSFLSRSYHESIKSATSFLADKIVVADGTIIDSEKIDIPMLFYSRPKGNYVGKKETDNVMLDFFLVNRDKLDQILVEVNINGEIHKVSDWQPYYIKGLPLGENVIKLTLMDTSGVALDIPLNPVTRVFNLIEDPADSL